MALGRFPVAGSAVAGSTGGDVTMSISATLTPGATLLTIRDMSLAATSAVATVVSNLIALVYTATLGTGVVPLLLLINRVFAATASITVSKVRTVYSIISKTLATLASLTYSTSSMMLIEAFVSASASISSLWYRVVAATQSIFSFPAVKVFRLPFLASITTAVTRASARTLTSLANNVVVSAAMTKLHYYLLYITLTGAVAAVASVSKVTARFKIIVANALLVTATRSSVRRLLHTYSASLNILTYRIRAVELPVFSAATTSALVERTVERVRMATKAVTATVLSVIPWTVEVALTTVATVTRVATVLREALAEAATSVGVTRVVYYLRDATVTVGADVLVILHKTLLAVVATAVALTRSVNKVIRAVGVMVVRALRLFSYAFTATQAKQATYGAIKDTPVVGDTPDTMVVPSENRSMTVPYEDRTMTVVAEDREVQP